jgi:hypothetical protein
VRGCLTAARPLNLEVVDLTIEEDPPCIPVGHGPRVPRGLNLTAIDYDDTVS